MQRERIADDIYVFVSERYAQVTATVIQTSDGVVLFDTLLYPEETRQIKRFVETRLGSQVRYIINSHFHADHTTGNCLFPDAQIVAHAHCLHLLDTRGRASLERARASSDEMRDVTLKLPNLTFDKDLFLLHVGHKSFELSVSPGHSADSITCYVREDRVLLAADTVMSLPFYVDGDYDALVTSVRRLVGGNYEHLVQGHGEVVLRGEIEEKLQSDLAYLERLRDEVFAVVRAFGGDTRERLAAITLERCGKSRVLLNGLAEALHQQNVFALAARLQVEN